MNLLCAGAFATPSLDCCGPYGAPRRFRARPPASARHPRPCRAGTPPRLAPPLARPRAVVRPHRGCAKAASNNKKEDYP